MLRRQHREIYCLCLAVSGKRAWRPASRAFQLSLAPAAPPNPQHLMGILTASLLRIPPFPGQKSLHTARCLPSLLRNARSALVQSVSPAECQGNASGRHFAFGHSASRDRFSTRNLSQFVRARSLFPLPLEEAHFDPSTARLLSRCCLSYVFSLSSFLAVSLCRYDLDQWRREHQLGASFTRQTAFGLHQSLGSARKRICRERRA
jgi:hypothetical protein